MMKLKEVPGGDLEFEAGLPSKAGLILVITLCLMFLLITGGYVLKELVTLDKTTHNYKECVVACANANKEGSETKKVCVAACGKILDRKPATNAGN